MPKPKVVLQIELTGTPPVVTIKGNVMGLSQLAEVLEQVASRASGKATVRGPGGVLVVIERLKEPNVR